MPEYGSGWPGSRRVVSLGRNLESPFFDSRWPQGNRDTATEPSWSAISTVSVDRGSSFPQTFANFTASALSDPDGIVTGISLIGNDLPAVSYDAATDTLTIASDPGADFSDSMQFRATTSAGSYDSPAFTVSDAGATGPAPNVTHIMEWNGDSLQDPVPGTAGGARMFSLEPNTAFDTVEKYSGTASLRMTCIGNDSGNQQLGVDGSSGLNWATLPWSQGTRYYRYFMKFDPGFRWGSGTAKIKWWRWSGNAGGLGAGTGYIDKDGIHMEVFHGSARDTDGDGVPEICSSQTGLCGQYGLSNNDAKSWFRINYDLEPQTNPDVTQWQEYIIACQFETGENAFNGELRFYVNGVRIGRLTGLQWMISQQSQRDSFFGAAIRPFAQLNGTSSDGGDFWVDETSISNEWNSLLIPVEPAL